MLQLQQLVVEEPEIVDREPAFPHRAGSSRVDGRNCAPARGAGRLRVHPSGFPDDYTHTVPHSELFTDASNYLADSNYSIPKIWPADMVQKFITDMRSHPANRSFRWLAEHCISPEMHADHAKHTARYVSLLSDGIAKSAAWFAERGQKLSRERVLHQERAIILQYHVLPVVSTMDALDLVRTSASLQAALDRSRRGDTVVARMLALKGEGGRQRIAALFTRMPALELLAELMTARVMNPGRRVTPQDFFDTEHASLAPAYVNVFVSLDGGLRNLISLRCKLPTRRGCRLLGSLDELRELAESLGR